MKTDELKYCYKYPRLAHTVDAIVVSENFSQTMVLLIQRKNPPYQGKWALPGGFIDPHELMMDAAKRELFEETGLTGIELKQFYTFDEVNRDPRHRTISTVFYGRIQEVVEVRGGDDASRADWFPILSLPEMAFDHNEILRKYIREQM